jgi:PAS domain S-box-containing protein
MQKGYASIALVPIRNNEKIVGLIQFNNFRKNVYNLNKIEFLEGIASHIGSALMRKQAEEALRRNEELLRTITENAPDIIIQLDRKGTVLYMNRALPGFTTEESLGKNFCEWTFPEYHDLMNQSLDTVFKKSATQTFLSRGSDHQGNTYWYRTSISPVKEGHTVKNAILITRDVTATILSEEILRVSEEKTNAIILTAMDGFWLSDRRGYLLEVNDTYCRMSGYSREELLTMRIKDVEVIENENDITKHIKNIEALGEDRFESRHRCKDGSVKNVEVSVQYRQINGGQFVAFIHDITERKKNEEHLRQSEERYKSLFQDNHSVMLLIQPETGEIIDANPTASSYYGWSKAELCSKNISEINTLSPLEVANEMQLAKEEQRNHFFFRHRLATNEIRDVEVFSGPIKFGEETMLYSLVHDITDRKIAEEALLQSESRYKSMFQDNQSTLLIIDPDSGEIKDANPAACEFYGWPYAELCKKNISEINPLPKDEISTNLRNSKNYRNNHLFFKHKLASGEIREVEVYSGPIKFGDSTLIYTIVHDITETKLAQEALQKNKENLRAILNATKESIYLFDKDGKVLDANITAADRLKLDLSELIGKKLMEILPIEIHQTRLLHINEVFNTGESVQFEDKRDEYVFEHNFFPVFQKDKVVNVVSFSRDISEKRKSEMALLESEKRLKYHFENSPLAVVEWDNDFNVTQWSVEAERMFGWTKEDTIGKRIDSLNLIYEEDIPIVNHTMERLTSGYEDKVVSTNRNITKSGELKTCIWYNSILFDQYGQMSSVMSLVQDITLEREADEALRLSERRLDAVFNSVTETIMMMNVEGVVLAANQTAALRWGVPVDELVGKNLHNFLSPEAKKKRESQIREMITTGIPIKFEDERGGIEYDLTFYPIRDLKGEIKQYVVFSRDITESKKAREELRKNEERYSMIYNSSRDSIFSFDLSGKMTGVNRSFCEEVNLEMSGIVGYTLKELQLSQFLGFEQENLIQQVIKANKSVTTELKIPTNDGSIRYFEVILNPMHDDSGDIIGISGSARNITRRKEAAQELLESEKRFRYLVKDMPVGVILFDSKSKVVMSNPKATELLGVNEDQVKGKYTTDDKWDTIREDGTCFPESERPVPLSFATGQPVRGVVIGVYRPDTADYIWLLIDTVIMLNEDGTIRNVIATFIDITERKAKEEALRKLNLLLSTLAKSSLAMAQAKDETDYLKKVCNIVVEETDFTMAWIGYAEEDKAKTIRPVASAGFNDEYLDTIKLSWDDNDFGRGPTGTAIRTGKVRICKNMLTDPTFKPWREEALKRGYASNIVFPLFIDEKVIGAITIYSKEPDSFLEDEIQLLSKLANDLSHGITTIRLRLAHDQAEEALVRSHNELETTVKERTAELIMTYEALKQTEVKYRTVADFATNWEFWIGPENQMIYCSPSCERITGYSSSEFVMNSQLIYSIIHPDDLQMFLDHNKKENVAIVCDHEIQYRIFKKDGSVRWMGHYCQPVYDEDGRFSGVRGSNKDITARKKMEELLTVSNQKYKMLSENINDGIFICKNGRFEYINQAISDIFGYSDHELVQMKLTQLVNTDYHEELEDFLYTNSSRNQSCNLEVECLRKDLTTVFVEMLLNYVATDNTVYGVVHDITEKKEFQKNMVKAIIQTEEKERSHFSKELHDGLGPLLSTIKLYLQWSEKPNRNKSRSEIIGKAGEILEEALGTVREISNKLSPHLLTNYGLNSAIKSFVDKLNATDKYNIELESNIDRRIDPETEAALYRAIIECINNTLKYAHANNIYINLTDTGNQIQISYKDDGIGFDLIETLAKHKGLGLFNLQNRLHTIGGKVDLNSEPGKGVNYMFTVNV